MSIALTSNFLAEFRKDLATSRPQRRGTPFGANAGRALEILIPAEGRDKAIQRLFNVSPRMALYLRRGKCWRADRLSQASAIFGPDFDCLLITLSRLTEPLTPPPADELHERFDRLEKLINEQKSEAGRRLSWDL